MNPGGQVGEDAGSTGGWTRDFGPLRDLTVVEIGTSLSTAIAGWVLESLGATVVCGPLDGTDTTHGDGSSIEIARRAVATRKQELAGTEELEQIAGSADVVIADTEAGWPWNHQIPDLPSYLEHVAEAPNKVWVTISPYGLSGPRATDRGTELNHLATSGLLHYTRGSDDEPVVPAGFQASLAAGHITALATIHGLSLVAEGAPRTHLEVSIQESVLATSVPLEVAHALLNLAGEPGTKRYGPPRGLLACADGHVYLSILEDHHWKRLITALEAPAWAANIGDLNEARKQGPSVLSRLSDWACTRSRGEIVSLLQANGVPATGVHSCWELLKDGDYVDRSYFSPDANGVPSLPGVPFLARSHGSGRHTVRPLRGCRVADLSHVLAGPLATSWLGAMGADVVRLEETHRLDIYRRLGPRPHGVAQDDPRALELSGYFAAVNHSKRSVDTASDTDTTTRDRMVGSADVIIENLSEHRRVQTGLDFDSVREVNRHAALISSSGFGRNSGSANYRVYGTNLHCHSGIVYHTRDHAGNVCNIGAAAWADPLTSIWVAMCAAVAYMFNDGIDFDISMAEVASRHLVDHFAVAAAETHVTDDPVIATDRPPFRIVNGADAPAVVVVDTEPAAHALAAWLGDAEASTALTDEDSSWEQVADECLAGLVDRAARMTAGDLVRALRSVGVLSDEVMDAYRLISDPHLNDREFFQPTPHTAWGEQRAIGLPWRLAGSGPIRVGPTPLVGEHRTSWKSDAAWDEKRSSNAPSATDD